MFAAVVPEKLIADKTGHHSLQALRTYERTQPSTEKTTDRVIADPAQSVSTENQLRDDHGTVTNSAIPTSVTNKQNSVSKSSSESAQSTEHVFSETLNNCTYH